MTALVNNYKIPVLHDATDNNRAMTMLWLVGCIRV